MRTLINVRTPPIAPRKTLFRRLRRFFRYLFRITKIQKYRRARKHAKAKQLHTRNQVYAPRMFKLFGKNETLGVSSTRQKKLNTTTKKHKPQIASSINRQKASKYTNKSTNKSTKQITKQITEQPTRSHNHDEAYIARKKNIQKQLSQTRTARIRNIEARILDHQQKHRARLLRYGLITRVSDGANVANVAPIDPSRLLKHAHNYTRNHKHNHTNNHTHNRTHNHNHTRTRNRAQNRAQNRVPVHTLSHNSNRTHARAHARTHKSKSKVPSNRRRTHRRKAKRLIRSASKYNPANASNTNGNKKASSVSKSLLDGPRVKKSKNEVKKRVAYLLVRTFT